MKVYPRQFERYLIRKDISAMGQTNENGEEEFRKKAIYVVRSIRLFHSL
jgi:hypothetical protein